jgi:hypothetical protein
LGDASKLYNFKSQKFDEAKAKELFNEWSNSYYSDFLKRTVLSLVELDPKIVAHPPKFIANYNHTKKTLRTSRNLQVLYRAHLIDPLIIGLYRAKI